MLRIVNSLEFYVEIGTVAALLLLIQFLRNVLKGVGKRYPPGPKGLPVVGYLPFVNDEPHLKLSSLAKKYGDIFGFYLGGKYCVVINDVENVKATFNTNAFSGRPPKSNLCPEPFKKTISNVNGRDWIEQRRFVFHSLRGFGGDKDYVENLVKEELLHFLRALQKTNSNPTDVQYTLSASVSNVVLLILFAKRYDYDDETRLFLNEVVQQQVEYTSQTAYHNYMPWVENFPLLNRYLKLDHFGAAFKKLLVLIEKEILEHRVTFDPNHIRDVTDFFLLQMKKACETKDTETSFTEDMLRGSAYTLLVAGSETVKTSLSWAFFVLAAHPTTQDRVRQEIDEVIGQERTPLTTDMKSMPFTQSFLMEVHRFRTVIPVNIIRYTLEDTKLSGYDIPKDTTVLSNIWAIHNDPKHWKDPEKFIPERFLSDDKSTVIKHGSFMPFSTGKRICPGEAMAGMEIFIFVTATLQRFNIRLPKDAVPDMDPVTCISAQPKAHDLIFAPRA